MNLRMDRASRQGSLRLRALAGVVFLMGLLLAAAPARDVEVFLREGNEAFHRGNYTAAVALYEEAEALSTNPKQVAFNMAVARFRLAQEKTEGRSTELRDAEKLFQAVRGSAKDATQPREARALYGLGLCLLNRASGGPGPHSQVGEDLQRAMDCFEGCRRLECADAELRMAARQATELARLRLAQFQGPQPRDQEESGNKEEPKQDRRDPRPQPAQLGDGSQQGFDKSGKTTNVAVKAEAGGPKPQVTDDLPPPGSNTNLPPVPDRADLPPLSPQDAAAHLEQASRRILDEERSHRQQKPRAAVKGGRDW